MVLWEKFALELVEFRERGTFCTLHPMYVPSKSGPNVSRDQACETRPRSRGLVVSRLVLQGLAARRNSIILLFICNTYYGGLPTASSLNLNILL